MSSSSASSGGFEESKFMKDLIHLRDTQEAIQGFSAWCIKHRKAAYKIARCWLKIVKKVRVDQKLTLFYLLNDIVQHCRRKNYSEFLSKFESVLKEAMPHLKDDKINAKLLRCIHIWSERNVFSESFLEDIKGIIIDDKDAEEIDNFQPTQLCTQIKIMKALEDDTDYKLKTLKDSEINIMDIDSLRQTLKDRQDGNDFISDFEKSTCKMQDYIKAIDKELGKRRKVIELLSNGGKYYESLLGEANIVANAYTNFEKRLQNLKRKLGEKIPELEQNPPISDSCSPIPSPDYDAPSPVNDEYELKLPGEESSSEPPCPPPPGGESHEKPNKSASTNGSRDLNQRLNSMMSSSDMPSSTTSSAPPHSADKNFSISEFLTRLAEGKPVDNNKYHPVHTSGGKASNGGIQAAEEEVTKPESAVVQSHVVSPPVRSVPPPIPLPSAAAAAIGGGDKWWTNPPPPPPPPVPPAMGNSHMEHLKWNDPSWEEEVQEGLEQEEWSNNQEEEEGLPSNYSSNNNREPYHHPSTDNNLINLVSGSSRREVDMDVVIDSDHEEVDNNHHHGGPQLSLQDRLKNLAGMPASTAAAATTAFPPSEETNDFNPALSGPPPLSPSPFPPPNMMNNWGGEGPQKMRPGYHHRGRPPYRGGGGRGGARGGSFHFERGRVHRGGGYRGRW